LPLLAKIGREEISIGPSVSDTIPASLLLGSGAGAGFHWQKGLRNSGTNVFFLFFRSKPVPTPDQRNGCTAPG